MVPSMNVMIPVGVPEPGATTLTSAVNVTDVWAVEGLREDCSVVDVDGAGFTCCVIAGDELAAKWPSSL
jgi:hypothetical protein